jgi:hypothetical protein
MRQDGWSALFMTFRLSVESFQYALDYFCTLSPDNAASSPGPQCLS